MNYEPLAKSLIATALTVVFSSSYAASVAPVAAENGMVVTAQHLATHVGVDVLKSGATRWMPQLPWVMRWQWFTRPRATSEVGGS